MYKSPPIYSPSHALYALKRLRAVATVNSRIHGGVWLCAQEFA